MEENKKIGLSGLLFLAMGTFSTMPVLEVSAAGRSVTFFSLTFFAALVFLWVRNKNFLRTPILTKPLRYFVLWMVTGIVAGCAGWLHFNGDSIWQSAATSYLPKLVLYIAFAILWEQGASEKDGRLVLKGLLLGAVLNCVWAVLDGLCYYVAHFSLNNVIFSTYIERHDIRLGQLSLILGNGLLRAAGFNTDPANIGFLGPVVVAYGLHKRRYGLTLIGLLSLVFSASTTAVVVTMVIFVLEWKNLIPKRKRPRKGMQMWMYLVILLGIAVAAAAAVRLMPLVIRAVGLFVERFNGAYLQSDVTSPRTVYYLGFFKALLTAGVMVLWNYLLTPLYTGMPREQIVPLLLTAFLPFNLLKGAANAALTLLLYKPLRTALQKARLLPAPATETAVRKRPVGLWLLCGLVLVTCVLLALSLAGIF